MYAAAAATALDLAIVMLQCLAFRQHWFDALTASSAHTDCISFCAFSAGAGQRRDACLLASIGQSSMSAVVEPASRHQKHVVMACTMVVRLVQQSAAQCVEHCACGQTDAVVVNMDHWLTQPGSSFAVRFDTLLLPWAHECTPRCQQPAGNDDHCYHAPRVVPILL
jgi:hypothetical protein